MHMGDARKNRKPKANNISLGRKKKPSKSFLFAKSFNFQIGTSLVPTAHVQYRGERDEEVGGCVEFWRVEAEDGVARGVNGVPKGLLPFPDEYQIPVGFFSRFCDVFTDGKAVCRW
jgi:hypothetical protein